MKTAIFPLVIFGVLLNAVAQLLLKAGMGKVGHFDFTMQQIASASLKVAVNPFVLAGLTSYVVSVGVWLLVLSRVDVSIAYPMVSIGYILNAVFAYYLFGEEVTLLRLSGIFVILLGVYLVARS